MAGTTESDSEQQGPAPEQNRPASETAATAVEAQLQAWVTLLQQALLTGRQLSTLLQLELKLALADGQRLLLVLLAMVPVFILAWLGFSVLVAWVIFLASSSVVWSLTGFVFLQIVTLLLLRRAARVFQRSLGLPATRRQVKALTTSGGSDGTKGTGTQG